MIIFRCRVCGSCDITIKDMECPPVWNPKKQVWEADIQDGFLEEDLYCRNCDDNGDGYEGEDGKPIEVIVEEDKPASA